MFFPGILLLFLDPMIVGNLISGSSAFSKSSLYIWNFLVHALLKPSLKDFEHNLANIWNECNCMVVWTFFGIAFLWKWNENWPFPRRNELLSYLGTSACYESDCFLLLLLFFTAFETFFGFLIKMCLIVNHFMLVLLGIHWTFGCVAPLLLSHLGSFQPLFIQVFFLTLSLISS